MTTMIDARIPSTHSSWFYESEGPIDIERWLEFLRHRGFTEIVSMSEDIPFVLTCPVDAECTRGWFVQTD